MKAIRVSLTALHLFVGVGALFGGSVALLNPTAPVPGMTTEVLRNGPFADFLIPGLFLFIVLGLGNVAGGVLALVRRQHPWQGYVTGVLGAAMVGWIVVQCLVLWSVNVLHVIFFLLGAAQGLLALMLLWGENRFPMDIARRVLGRAPVQVEDTRA